MNNAYMFSYALKHSVCPNCGKREFKQLINNTGESFFYQGCRIDAGEPIIINGVEYGKCERINNCGYNMTLTPSEVFKGKRIDHEYTSIQRPEPTPKETIYFNTDAEALKTLEVWRIERNSLFKYLASLFGYDTTLQAFQRYKVGAEFDFVYWWMIDTEGRCRNANMMLYKPNGHRNGEAKYREDSYFSKLSRKGLIDESKFAWQRCCFGSHLLSVPENKDKPVMIYESEKSALISSIWFPEYVSIATSSSVNFQAVKLPNLSGRDVVVMPDYDIGGMGGYRDGKWIDGWKQKFEAVGRGTFCNRITFREWYTEPSVLSLEGWKLEDKCDFADYICAVMEIEKGGYIAPSETPVEQPPIQEKETVQTDYRVVLRQRLNTFFSFLIPCDGIGMQYFEIKERATQFGKWYKIALEKFFEIAVSIGVLRYDSLRGVYLYGGIRQTGLLLSAMTISEWTHDHDDWIRQQQTPIQETRNEDPF